MFYKTSWLSNNKMEIVQILEKILKVSCIVIGFVIPKAMIEFIK